MKSRENLLRAIRRTGPAWVPNGMEGVVTIEPPVIERPYAAGTDPFGVKWDIEEKTGTGTYPAHGGWPLKDFETWRNDLRVPNLDTFDWSGAAAKADAVDRTESLVQGFVHMGLFERSWLLLGMEEALVQYVTAPDEMRDVAGIIADYKIEVITRLHERINMDILWLGDDWGTQNALFLPPEIWRKTIKPHTKRIYDACKRLGIIINQHSCGMIEPIFADMVEMGADMWNPCQPCNDLAALKRAFGDRMTFCGGIDSQFILDRPGVTAEEVRSEVRGRIDTLAPGGGYIAMPSHGVPYDKAILTAMNEEIASHGGAFYN